MLCTQCGSLTKTKQHLLPSYVSCKFITIQSQRISEFLPCKFMSLILEIVRFCSEYYPPSPVLYFFLIFSSPNMLSYYSFRQKFLLKAWGWRHKQARRHFVPVACMCRVIQAIFINHLLSCI